MADKVNEEQASSSSINNVLTAPAAAPAQSLDMEEANEFNFDAMAMEIDIGLKGCKLTEEEVQALPSFRALLEAQVEIAKIIMGTGIPVDAKELIRRNFQQPIVPLTDPLHKEVDEYVRELAGTVLNMMTEVQGSNEAMDAVSQQHVLNFHQTFAQVAEQVYTILKDSDNNVDYADEMIELMEKNPVIWKLEDEFLPQNETEEEVMSEVMDDLALADKVKETYQEMSGAQRSDFLKKRKKGKLPKKALLALENWWNENLKHPYPNDAAKRYLEDQTELTPRQINNWFINQRKRHWLPAEEPYIGSA